MGLASNIKQYLSPHWEMVLSSMSKVLESDIELLNKSNDYIFSNAGKMLRPMLALLVAKLCNNGQLNDDCISFASASELLHNATLLHDDVADDSPLRRGKPTIMSEMGAKASVLIGDYWLVKSIEKIIESPKHGTKAMVLFSKTLSDLAKGEMLQLEKAVLGDTDIDTYLRIIYYKTVSLFEATVATSALAVEADQVKTKAVINYILNLGYAFQIKDDILDYSTSSQTGKPVGIDIKEKKITIPLLLALSSVSEQKEKEIRAKVQFSDNEEVANEIMTFVLENEGVEKAEKELDRYVELAVKELEIFEESLERRFLEEIALFVSKRQS